jgi:hypothetical protein
MGYAPESENLWGRLEDVSEKSSENKDRSKSGDVTGGQKN